MVLLDKGALARLDGVAEKAIEAGDIAVVTGVVGEYGVGVDAGRFEGLKIPKNLALAKTMVEGLKNAAGFELMLMSS